MTLQGLEKGSEDWWQAVQQQGVPRVVRLSHERCDVTFYWRDPQGNENTSALRHVWLYITGVTDHHSCSCPVSLMRLPGTDVWQWNTELPATWRGSYCFIPSANENDFSSDALRVVPDRQALRRGWQHLLPSAIADALNPHSWRGGRGHPTSALHLPDAPPQPGWDASSSGNIKPLCITWHSERLQNSRRVWLFSTGDLHPAQRPLAILLDGQFWAESMPVWPALEAQTLAGKLPPALYVLIDVIDQKHRASELPCNADFWHAVYDELLVLVRAHAAWDENPQRTVVAGQSFGGLAALYAVLNWPARFGCALSQSASCWWPHRQKEDTPGLLEESVASGHAGRQPVKLFMEAGVREPLIYRAHQRLVPLLQKTQRQLFWRPVEGGHDALCWRGGLTQGLAVLWAEDPSS